jgi:hypothetical protein
MVQKKIAVVIPQTPSFIQVGTQWHSVSDFTDGELREIGKKWIEKLVDKAKQKRKMKD